MRISDWSSDVCSSDLGPVEYQAPTLGIHAHGVAAAELATEDLLCQRILQLLLDRALERTRAVDRVEADVAEQVERLVRHLDADAALGQAPFQAAHLDARDQIGRAPVCTPVTNAH